MTTTTHRPGCGRTGWHIETGIRGVVAIARCTDCRAVEIRTPITTERNDQ